MKRRHPNCSESDHRAKPRHASPNCLVKSALFWDIMQPRVETPSWCFGTTYWSHLQRSKHPKDKTQHAPTQSYFLGLCLSSKCLKQHSVSEASSAIFKHWHHRSVLKYVPEKCSTV